MCEVSGGVRLPYIDRGHGGDDETDGHGGNNESVSAGVMLGAPAQKRTFFLTLSLALTFSRHAERIIFNERLVAK